MRTSSASSVCLLRVCKIPQVIPQLEQRFLCETNAPAEIPAQVILHPSERPYDALALTEGGREVDRSFQVSGIRPAWLAQCGERMSPLKQVWFLAEGPTTWSPRLFPDESNCAALPPGSETGGSGGFGYRPQHAEPITGYGAKAPGSASPWCVDDNSRSPYRERTADPGRVRHAHSLAQASTGTTHGAIPRAPLPHCRGTGLKHPGRRAPV